MLAGALAAALALGAAPAALAAEPQMQVRAANIDNEYLEIGLVIPAETTMQSAAVVLTYDAAKLEPVDWSGTAVTPGVSWDDAAQLPAKGSDATTGKPALVYEDGGKGYLLLSAESAKALTVTGSTALQATTVRFRYETDKPTSDTTEPIGNIALASAEEAAGSPAGQPTLFSDGTQNVALTVPPIIYDNAATSVAGGSGDASSFAPIVFYDWDGTTMLGSIVVDISANSSAIQSAVDQFTNTLKAAEEELNGNLFYPNADKPLTYKKGYTFGRWIRFDSVDVTSYGDAVAVDNGNTMTAIPEPNPADFSLLTVAGLSVKAAYFANEDMQDLTSSTDREYTIETTGFNRFGFSENFSVDIKIARSNGSSGVHRCREPYLRVQMKLLDGNSLYQLIAISNTDEATAQTVPNASVAEMYCTVVDGYQVTDWVNGAASRSSASFYVPAVSSEATQGFLRYGTLTFMNEQLSASDFEDNAMWSMTDTIVKEHLGLDCTFVYDDIFTALSNVKQAWDTKNPEYMAGTAYASLTFEEMQYAVDHDGALKA